MNLVNAYTALDQVAMWLGHENFDIIGYNLGLVEEIRRGLYDVRLDRILRKLDEKQ